MGDRMIDVSYKSKHILMIPSRRKKEFQKLVYKYLQGKATPEEKAFIEKYYQYFDKQERITPSIPTEEKAALENRLLQKITGSIQRQEVIPLYKKPFFRSAAAAAILLLVSASSYLLFFHPFSKPEQTVSIPAANDVKPPGTNRAMITLANGQTIYLDSAANGSLTMQENVQLVKLADGQIAYKGSARETVYNTLTNPRNSKVIDITLADGSRVWLNAGSSLVFPVAFTGKERTVSVSGEAYFEVAHHAAMPFKVRKGETEITVLGTRFNVNAYDDDDALRITLLEGSVKIAKGSSSGVLKPGQQAVLAPEQGATAINVINTANMEETMAWKNGFFLFENADIETVMLQLSRWYDAEVVFKSRKAHDPLYVKISRDTRLSDVLKALEISGGARFNIEEGKIIVMQ